MRRLIADLYKILLSVTGNKLLSLAASIVYITVLNLFTIYGFGVLLEDLVDQFAIVHRLFSFPTVLGVAVVALLVNFLIMLPLNKLDKEQQNKPFPIPIIIYSAVSLLLYLYTFFSTHNLI